MRLQSLLACSIVASVELLGCASSARVAGSDVVACNLDPQLGGLHCSNEAKTIQRFVKFAQADGWLCLEPERDGEEVLAPAPSPMLEKIETWSEWLDP